jgi:glucose dehydrogenase
MTDYFWSARFICGAVTLALGVAMLIGGLMFLPYGRSDDWYFPAVGVLLCMDGVLLALSSRVGLALYAALLLGAIVWTLHDVGLDVWELMPNLLALGLWGAILLTLRHRIAPTHDPAGRPAARVHQLVLAIGNAIREHC